jgi:5-(carboxyamino)imidazole ribonucleotide synthase
MTPCKIACDQFFKGDLMDFDTVYDFGKKVDVLTFEIELVNLEALVKLENEGLKVYPSQKTLKLIQNKGIQKHFIQNIIFHRKLRPLQQSKSLIVDILDSKLRMPFVWKCTEFDMTGTGKSY